MMDREEMLKVLGLALGLQGLTAITEERGKFCIFKKGDLKIENGVLFEKNGEPLFSGSLESAVKWATTGGLS